MKSNLKVCISFKNVTFFYLYTGICILKNTVRTHSFSRPKTVVILPRRVKALHPTRSTEGVLRLVCIKRVCGQIVFALYESELWFRNNEVLVLLFVTNGTIAVVHNKPFWRQNFKSDGVAMAAASVECVWCCHGSCWNEKYLLF